jgi:hypothetical protein
MKTTNCCHTAHPSRNSAPAGIHDTGNSTRMVFQGRQSNTHAACHTSVEQTRESQAENSGTLMASPKMYPADGDSSTLSDVQQAGSSSSAPAAPGSDSQQQPEVHAGDHQTPCGGGPSEPSTWIVRGALARSNEDPVAAHASQASSLPLPSGVTRSEFWFTVLSDTHEQNEQVTTDGARDTQMRQPHEPEDPMPVEPNAFPVAPRVALSRQVSPLSPTGRLMSDIVHIPPVIDFVAPSAGLSLSHQSQALVPHETESIGSTSRHRRPPAQRKFICTICQQTFERKGHRDSHYEAVHQRIQKHKCFFTECGRAFGHRSSLNRHLRSVHDVQDVAPTASHSAALNIANPHIGSEDDGHLMAGTENDYESSEDDDDDDSSLYGHDFTSNTDAA